MKTLALNPDMVFNQDAIESLEKIADGETFYIQIVMVSSSIHKIPYTTQEDLNLAFKTVKAALEGTL